MLLFLKTLSMACDVVKSRIVICTGMLLCGCNWQVKSSHNSVWVWLLV